MQTVEAIERRRSIRSFREEKIPEEIIVKILNCARLAPSAKNRQPWFFVVLEDDAKREVTEMMRNYFEEDSKIKSDFEEEKTGYMSSVLESADCIDEAPILILILKEKDDKWNIGDNISIGAALENMCLAATAFGLGSLCIRDTVWIGEDLVAKLKYENKSLVCSFAIGYTKREAPPRNVKNLNEIIDWRRERTSK